LELDAFGAGSAQRLKNEWLSGTWSNMNASVLDLFDVSIDAKINAALCIGNVVRDTIATEGCTAPKKRRFPATSSRRRLPSYENVILVSQHWGANYFYALIEGLP
jgi:hypothetical protein